MPRRRAGPVRIGNRATWYARLTIPPQLRSQAGKTRLIRSLGTTDHGLALARYGAVYVELERELKALLNGQPLRERLENWSVPELSPYEAAAGALNVRELDPQNPQHETVYNSIANDQPLPISWDEALELWEKIRNRSRERPISKSGRYNTHKAVERFREYAEPHQVTKAIVRQWLSDQEEITTGTTVAAKYRLLRAVMQVLVDEDKLSHNVFSTIAYTARANKDDARRPFTDEELKIIHAHCPRVFKLCMLGLRVGEYVSRQQPDLKDGVLSIDEQLQFDWRPKTLTSYRRVPVYDGFEVEPESKRGIKTRVSSINKELRAVITDKNAVVHSARHTFITLSRRAQCDTRVIEVLTGHGKTEGSATHAMYGEMPDEVLHREIQKVWSLVDSLVGN